jgi:hypothetical protein
MSCIAELLTNRGYRRKMITKSTFVLETMDTSRHLLIGQILVDLGFLNMAQVEEALRKQAAYPGLKIGEILKRMEFITQEQLDKGLQFQNKVE